MLFEEYKRIEAINAHILKTVKNPRELYDTLHNPGKFVVTGFIIVGDAVDCLITSPTTFKNRFIINLNVETPTDTLVKIINNTIATINTLSTFNSETVLNDDEIVDILVKESIKSNYQGKWTMPTRVTNIRESCLAYTKVLLKAKAENKLIIDKESFQNIKKSYRLFRTDADPNIQKEYKEGDRQVHYQYYIKWFVNVEGEEKECKSLIDILEINFAQKTIRVNDLKVTAISALSFHYDIVSNDHILQAAFYYDAVQYMIEHYPEFEGFTQLEPRFIVVSYTSNQVIHYVFPEALIDVGRLGKSDYTIPYMGYLERIEALMYHVKTGNFRYPFYCIERSRHITLKTFANDCI
mgnify:CR=1 FL=1